MGGLHAFINIRIFRINCYYLLGLNWLKVPNVDNIPISCLISKPMYIQVAILLHTLWAYCVYDLLEKP